MSRLTNRARAQIVDRVLDQSPLLAQIEAESHKLARLSIEHLKEQWSDHQEAMDALPEGFFPTLSGFYVYADKSQGAKRIYIDAVAEGFLKMRIPHTLANSYQLRSVWIDKSTKLMRQTFRRYQALVADQKLLRTQSEGILQSCTTLKMLLKTWPEVEHLVPECILDKHKQTGVAIVSPEILNAVNKNIKKRKK